jgi:acetyltransferase (GNAT) family protein
MRIAMCPTQLHFRKLANHFVGLTSGDRFLRFGWVATDVDLVAYVESLFVSAASVFAVVEPDGDISGVLHLEFTNVGANLGLSVSSWARNQGIGTVLLQQAGLLACAQRLKTLFARNLNFNPALQQLALRLGMNVACTSNALITRAQTRGSNSHDVERDGFCGKITVVDDSLRSQWDGAPFEAETSARQESILSEKERTMLAERLAIQ